MANRHDVVLFDLGGAPSELSGLDDNRLNVEGALAAGLDARRARGPDEPRAVRRELEVVIG